VLADFRRWLQSAATEPADGDVTPGPRIDLHTLLGQFLALKHEVNLQTRASRAQQEQSAAVVELLEESLDELRQARHGLVPASLPARSLDDEERLRPLIKTLIDLHDALSLASKEVGRSHDELAPLLDKAAELVSDLGTEQPHPAAMNSFWSRLLRRRDRTDIEAARRRQEERAARARQLQEVLGQARQVVTSLLEGYSMSLQRVERALAQQGLEPIGAAGRSFDPERMEVVEAVSRSGRPAGEVLDEVRRGYVWRGRVFRCAQVRVARG
jgi:molecular chaperone GrpE